MYLFVLISDDHDAIDFEKTPQPRVLHSCLNIWTTSRALTIIKHFMEAPIQHPTNANQVYRWYPRERVKNAGDVYSKYGIDSHPFASSQPQFIQWFKYAIPVERHNNGYNSTALCTTPINPKYTGYNSEYAFEPEGFRVSKIVWCTHSYSIRLVNYRSS